MKPMPMLEARVTVSKVQDTKAKDDSVVVTLKGTKTIVLQSKTGYEFEDTAEITITVRVGSMSSAKALGIEGYENSRVMVLRDQDQSLQSFEDAMEGSMGVTLDAYRGIVPDETLDNIEREIPANVLEEIA